jgi:hypothetical protein
MRRIRKRDEDEADKWLRENDPYYTDMSRGKSHKLKHPYYTPDQEVARARKEIAISQLGDADLDYLSLNRR